MVDLPSYQLITALFYAEPAVSGLSDDADEAASEFFGLTLQQARAIIKVAATVPAPWRGTAKAAGARSAEITRMTSAFERDDLKRALAL